MVIFNNIGAKISQTDITELEKRIGFSLPDSYQKFLIQYNGGNPEPDCFIIPNCQHIYSIINNLWGVLPNQWNDLEENIEIFEHRFPQGFISIGRDLGSSQILISLEEKTYGKIYYWDVEEEPQDDINRIEDYSNLFLVAENFESFLSNIKSEKEINNYISNLT